MPCARGTPPRAPRSGAVLLSAFAGAFATSLFTSPANAADFDAASMTFRLDPAASIRASLDDPNGTGGLPARLFDVYYDQGYAALAPGSGGTGLLDGDFAKERGVEGKGALRVLWNRTVLFGDAETFAGLAKSRVEVKALVRAEGAMPELRAIYSKRSLDGREVSFPSAQVVALRTGQATSDGWVELSTGPIDGSIGSTPLAGIVILPSHAAPAMASFLVDALEVKKVADGLLSGSACTIAHEAEQCKKGAVCAEGMCIDAAAVYGALPPEVTRRDIVTRATTYMTRFQEDRHASDAAVAGFAASMPAIAALAETPEAFFRPYLSLIGGARGAHTGAPQPNPYSRIASGATTMVRSYGSELNACFGIVEKNLSGGGRGYGVYRTAEGSPLRVGDVIDTVDGEPIDAWIARFAAEHALLAADPDSDRPYIASSLHMVVMRYAKEASVSRCTGPGACTPVTIDVAMLRKSVEKIAAMECSPRFQLAVDVPTGTNPDAYESAISQTSAIDGSVSLHTNGEPPDDASWNTIVRNAFESGTDKLLVDKRRGDGGGGYALEMWASYLRRGPSFGLFFVPRIDHTQIDGPPGFLADLLGTCSGKATGGKCALAQLETYVAKAGGLPARTAWLTVLDGSASDMSTYFAKGAAGVRVFGPNRTLGLFGGLGVMGSFLPGWTGGYVQLGDVRSGATNAERVSGTWHSGRGVEPDELVVQTQSDLVAGKDTMLERARAWLATGE